MLHERVPNLAKFVEPDRVRREVYTDAAIFEMEMERIHERVWIYCGHETQVPKAGDYYATRIGRQPMLMVRGKDGKVNVLYNRCPHRGSMMCGDRSGNAGEFFRCSYHSWTFHHDGKLRAIPMMESGYAGTRWTRDNPDCNMKRAAREVELEIEKRTGKIPLSYHMLSAFSTVTIEKWDNFQTLNYPYGHCILTGYMGLRPQDPETLEYERVLAKAYGEKRKEEILSTNIHHVLIYPGLSVQSPLQQLRAVRPLGVDKTLTEIWHFRLKGAPEPIYRRALAYYNLVNSPSTLINADDLENFWKAHQGLSSDGGDWVSFHRHYGRDAEKDGIVETAPNCGTSEAPMRNQMKAWTQYMASGK